MSCFHAFWYIEVLKYIHPGVSVNFFPTLWWDIFPGCIALRIMIFFLLAHYEEDTSETQGKKPEEAPYPSFRHCARSRKLLWSLWASDGDQKDDCLREERLTSVWFSLVTVLSLRV